MNAAMKCDRCGKFVSYESLGRGWATMRLTTPDSHFTVEEWEIICEKCAVKEHKHER